MTVSEFLSLCFAAIFAENAVLTRIFGVDALGKKAGSIYKACLGMIPVMTLATPLAMIIDRRVLAPFGMEYLRLVVFTAIAAFLAKLVEALYNSITKGNAALMPLVTFNCALIGVMLEGAYGQYTVLGCVVLGLASALGFVLALAVFHGVKQRLVLAEVSPSFEGAPVTLLAIGLVIMAFMGAAGVDLGEGLLSPFKLV